MQDALSKIHRVWFKHGLNWKVPASQAQSPELKPQYNLKEKKENDCVSKGKVFIHFWWQELGIATGKTMPRLWTKSYIQMHIYKWNVEFKYDIFDTW
jgi:hypothetical protein